VLRRPINLAHDTASVYLRRHNYLRRHKPVRRIYSLPGTFVEENTETGTINPGSWRLNNSDIIILPLQTAGGKVAYDAK
jgi:hypothetical protein